MIVLLVPSVMAEIGRAHQKFDQGEAAVSEGPTWRR
jgi:hypothetical protein